MTRAALFPALAALASTLAAGCTGELTGGRLGGELVDAASPPPGPDGGVIPDAAPDAMETALPSVTFEAPDEGARFVRDTIVEEAWAARVLVRVRATGVARIDLEADGGFFLGTLESAPYELSYDFFADGERTLFAIGRDASGAEIARDERRITITPPSDTSCHGMLDALGLDWEPLASLRGVTDPVRVQPEIEGVRFRYVSSASPTPMSMDCELAPRLVRLARLVAEYGIDEVQHIGIYNYRCIGGGDPDSGTCTPSQHAYARAIDLHAFQLAGSDVVYSTETDWVITSRGDPCPIMSSTEEDRVLKEIACRMWSDRIFQIVLTPNYNDAHRNHFHVDLTAGSMYLGAGASGVDPVVDGLGD